MSKRDDDDELMTFLAWMWVLDRDDKELEQAGMGIGCVILMIIFGIMHANKHPLAIAVEVGVMAWVIWKYGKSIAKFMIYSVFSFFVAFFLGSTIVLLVKLSAGENLRFFDYLFITAGYVGTFLYSYFVTCPWITKKAREFLTGRK